MITFLKDRGNLKEVQSDMQISYPTAKKKLDELLAALNLGGGTEKVMPKEIDVSRMDVDYTSTLASEIIKAKLKAHGGHITVYTARGLPCEIYAESDGTTFTSDKLPVKPAYDYKVFDDMPLEGGLCPADAGGRLSSALCRSITEALVDCISAGRAVGRGYAGAGIRCDRIWRGSEET